MKKLLVLTSALLICGASIASAAVPGANLSWSNCATTAAAQNYTFACDDNALTKNLVASFRVATAVPDFVAIGISIDYSIGDPGTPPYFQFGSAECREGSFAPINVGTLTSCTNAFGGAGQSGGSVIENLAPNKWRVRGQWARDAAIPLNVLANSVNPYACFVMQLNTAGAAPEDPLPAACPGCEVPACFVVNSLQVYSLANGLAADIQEGNFRNYVTYQGGGIGGAGCPAETPSKAKTWGAVKALYR